MTEFTTAVELKRQLDQLQARIHRLDNKRDLLRYLDNIGSLVTDLSRREVVARRTRQYYGLVPLHEEINSRISYLERLIFMTLLSQ